jgi:hypothetical protein
LEEERIDFFKNSLWTFANIASTVCVSDDAVRLSAAHNSIIINDRGSHVKRFASRWKIAKWRKTSALSSKFMELVKRFQTHLNSSTSVVVMLP